MFVSVDAIVILPPPFVIDTFVPAVNVAFANVLPEELVENLIQMAGQSVTWQSRSDKYRQDMQIALDPFWPQIAMDVNNYLLNNMFTHYLDDFPYLQGQGTDWWSGSVILQKTEPMQGYHSFHCEDIAWGNRQRVLAWMVYLNDVEEGGDTEWLYQQKKVQPKANVGLLWPGSFTHLHRGNPPISGTKYVLTGWFASMVNMNRFNVEHKNS